MDTTLKTLQDRVLAAVAERRTLRIVGGASKSFYGNTAADQGEPLHTQPHTGIVSYEPTELVITARCGTPLADIEAALAAQGQSLAFEPPNFNHHATIGGVVAAGLSGPSRLSAGSVRDYVLGTQLLDGRGQILNFGGVVMKNVAGYDVSRLLTGSLGALGVITQVSIKVWPVAKVTAYLQFAMPLPQAIIQLNQWGGQPLPISASCFHQDVLTVRLSGAQAAIDAALKTMGGTRIDAASNAAAAGELFTQLRHQTHAFFAAQAGRTLMRLSLPQAAPPLGIDGQVLIEWGGAQRWIHTTDIASTRAKALAAGGHATVWRSSQAGAQPVFTPLDAVSAAIHARLRAEYDPSRVFANALVG
jgi:glycolate oxidase FAD binding subunit